MHGYKNAVLFLLGLLLFYLAMPNIYLHIGWLAWGAFVPLLVMLDKQVSAKK
jgi:apolipoprotein N-acyltransferase